MPYAVLWTTRGRPAGTGDDAACLGCAVRLGGDRDPEAGLRVISQTAGDGLLPCWKENILKGTWVVVRPSEARLTVRTL